jgi:methionine-gamma-lyase
MNGLRGLRTLAVRLRQQTETAGLVAAALEADPRVESVSYPGLESFPQADLARRQLALPGGLITFDLGGGFEAGRAFVEATSIAQLATSLGGPETLVTHPASTTHVGLLPEELAAAQIGPGTIRVSIGLEHPDDVLADLLGALDACPS